MPLQVELDRFGISVGGLEWRVAVRRVTVELVADAQLIASRHFVPPVGASTVKRREPL